MPRRPTNSRLLLVLAFAILAGGAEAKPSRIVSLNLCTDQVLVDLVESNRIAGLSFLARDPRLSPVAEQAMKLRQLRGHAEEVLELDPDLILSGPYTTPATVALLRRLGRNVVVLPMAENLMATRSFILRLAAAVEEPDRGRTLIAAMDRRIARVSAKPNGRKLEALVYHVNGVVSTAGSLGHEVLMAAGLANKAGDPASLRSLRAHAPLEALVTDPPDLLILAQSPGSYRSPVADNLRHPALRHILEDVPSMVMPEGLLLCGTHHLAEAVESVARARDRLAR